MIISLCHGLMFYEACMLKLFNSKANFSRGNFDNILMYKYVIVAFVSIDRSVVNQLSRFRIICHIVKLVFSYSLDMHL